MQWEAARGLVWVYIFFFALVLLLQTFYTPTAATFVHTYELGTPPGTLLSKRWSFDFVLIGFYSVVWLVPLSAAFAVSARERWRQVLHNTIAVLLLLWLVAVFIVGCVDWASANSADPGNFFNRANDPRWCCVYFALPGAPCANTVACTPGVGAADLIVNRSFLFQVWMTFVLAALLVVDVIIMQLVVAPAAAAAQEEGEEEGGDPEAPAPTAPLLHVEGRARGGRAAPYRGKFRA
jgi:preprotein translocase subunit SecG